MSTTSNIPFIIITPLLYMLINGIPVTKITMINNFQQGGISVTKTITQSNNLYSGYYDHRDYPEMQSHHEP